MINWDLWNQAGQKLQNEARELYDFSWVTPEVVKGFTRYQALSPEQDVKRANKYKEILEKINDEDLNTIFGNELDEDEESKKSLAEWKAWQKDKNPSKEVEIGSPDSGRIQRSMADGSYPEHIAGNIPTEAVGDFKEVSDYGVEETPYKSTYDRDALIEKYMRNSLGSDYDDYKRAYDIYGKLNPYEQMIEAGKRSSYWDPEIGKIYTDAGEKIRNDRIAAWKEALEGETMLQNRAMDMYKETKYSRYRKEAEKRLDKITDLLNNNPRKTGKWFEGYDTDPQTNPETASAYDKIEKKLINEGPLPPQELAALIEEYKLQGEDATDLLKQNDDLWAMRYGPQAAVTKRTEEAIRAQSDTFKADQRKRTQLKSAEAGEATYRMAAETLKKLDLDITQSFDDKTKREIERARKKMIDSPSFASIGSFLVLVGGQKLGLTPEGLNSITTDGERKELIKQAVETLYETDRAMYEVARQRMLKDIEGVPGINTSVLSWMNERKPMIPETTTSTLTFSKDVKPTVEQLKAANPGLENDKDFKNQWNVVVNNWSKGGGKNWVWNTTTGKITKRVPVDGNKKQKEPLAAVKVPAGNNSPLLKELLKD